MNTFARLSTRALIFAIASVVTATSGFATTTMIHKDTDPGWTGHTIVLGSHSTLAGNAEATQLQQNGQYS
jgi:hypothetical protein